MQRDEILRLQARVQELERQLAARTHDLEEALLKNEQLAVTDGLTGVANRRQFFVDYERLLQQAARTRRPFAVLIVDVQHFRAINDQHGHMHGDAVLKDVAYILRDNARSIDILGRTGGDEFSLALPETDLQGAQAVGDRLRRGVESFHVVSRDSEEHPLSLAIGGCVLNDLDKQAGHDAVATDDFYQCAMHALEAAQRKIASQVVCVTYGNSTSPLDMP